MRASYLATDRPELTYASEEAARDMQNPTRQSMERLKTIAWFLVAYPRLVQVFRPQPVQYCMRVFTDSDHAGCKKTRRYTTAGGSFHGEHFLGAWATTQRPIATSAGESEFYSIFKGASRLVGLMGMVEEYGVPLGGELHTDSSTGIGIAGRRGVGAIRHLHTQSLWVQQKVDDKTIKIKRVLGTQNPMDLPTKHVAQEDMWRMLSQMGFEVRQGFNRLAIQVQGKNKEDPRTTRAGRA